MVTKRLSILHMIAYRLNSKQMQVLSPQYIYLFISYYWTHDMT